MALRWRMRLAVLLICLGCGSVDAPADGVAGSGGDGGNGGAAVVLPWPLTEFPALPAEIVELSEDRFQLGRLLFYDPILSIDRETACATCHSEFWGMSDAIPVGIGHGAGPNAGPGREGPNVSRRNSLALFNLVFRETFLWDGRAETLEEQALMPLLAREELDIDPEEAVRLIAEIPEYVERFAAAFPEDPVVSTDNLAAALADFQRTFVSNRSLYDAYVAGQAETFDEELVQGMFRFAEMGCAECHAPPLFESETFANRRVPPVDGVVDLGLAEVTESLEDLGKFRTPSLRNAFVTDPYFHNGSVGSLRVAVTHELEQSGEPFTDEDVRLILGFIDRALRDPSRGAQRPESVPSGLQIPLDGER